MATTAKGTPYVESTDLVANYPAASLALANHIDDFTGKFIQVVRATDSTARSTTSATFVDANISVTITPEYSTSAILLIWAAETSLISSGGYFVGQITDNSNNQIAGPAFIGNNAAGFFNYSTFIAHDTPATTSATTYKGRFRIATGGTAQLNGNGYVGQLFAIEVAV